MRQREQHDMSDEVRRELDALDRALAGEPVDAQFDAVARLAWDLREAREKPSEDFAARLDERVEGGFRREPGSERPTSARFRDWLEGIRPMRLLAPAGAVATVVVVASVAVIQSGGGTEDGTPVTTDTAAQEQGRDAATRDAAPAQPDSAGGAVAPGDAEIAPFDEGGAPENYTLEAPSANDASDRQRVAPNEDRDVERSATLALSSDEDEFEGVSDGVVSTVDRYEGFVISSEESSSGESSRAVFELKTPTQNLNAALADLSDLAHVESRTEDALDITAQTDTARQRLTDTRTEVRGLLRQLATAESTQETEDIKFRLGLARQEVAQAKADLKRLALRANYSDVRVTVEADGGGDGDWGIEEAIDDIGGALSTAGGVALVSLAILLPIGLVIALIGLAWRRSVSRGREHALGE